MVVGKKHGHQGAGLFEDLIFALWPWSDTGPLGPLVFILREIANLLLNVFEVVSLRFVLCLFERFHLSLLFVTINFILC